MSSSVKVVNTITETNSQGIIDAVDSLMVSGHQTDSFPLAASTSVFSTTYNVNDFKGTTIMVQTSTDASLKYQVQWSNNQTKWYSEYTTDVYAETNPDGTVTFYQGNSTFSQNSGKFMRIEYYNPDTSSTNVDAIINFLH